jgi:baculoviral IAP repeat-containing protein 6
MAECELTIPILVGYRPQFSSPGLAARMWNQGQLEWQREEGGEVEMALPLLEHFKKLKKQAETFLQTTKAQFSDDHEDPAFAEGWSLCSDIVSAQDNIKRAMGALQQFLVLRTPDVQASFGPAPGSNASTSANAGPVTRSSARASKGKGKAVEPANQAPAPDMEKEYSLACEKLSFEYVSLANPDTKNKSGSGLVYSGYKFADQLKQTQNATRNPKDRIHFAKELAVTATSLPPGIWVRVDDVRNDAMSVIFCIPFLLTYLLTVDLARTLLERL